MNVRPISTGTRIGGRRLVSPLAVLAIVAAALALLQEVVGGPAPGEILPFPGGDHWLEPQSSYDRVFRPTDYSLVWSVAQAAEPFYGILRVKVDGRGRVYVADHGDLRIKVLEADGTPGPVYGVGRGQGPGELTFLNDLQPTDSGQVWISDIGNGRINIFSPEGEFQHIIVTEELPYRLVVDRDENGFTSLMIVHSETLLAQFDTQGKLVARVGRLMDHQAKRSLAFDGWIEGDSEGGIVYAGLYGGVLARYGPNGEQLFVRQTIDRRPLPKLEVFDGSLWIDQEAPVSTGTLSVTDEGIHLLTYYRSGFKNRKVVDTYDRDDGSYLYSRPVPENCSWLVQTEGHVYTVGRDLKVSKWTIARHS